MTYGELQGKKLYSDYTPRIKVNDYEEKISELVPMLENYDLTSITFKHVNDYIQLSLIDDEYHIDNVTDYYNN